MMKKEGFTLIELMIVVAIIAIIAAIAIPNLLSSRISANETGALGGLRTILTAETTWRQSDADGNGKQDFWTYDVSAFYRMYRADLTSMVQSIDVSLAKADINPHADNTFGAYTQDWTGVISTTAKSGYRFRAMVNDVAAAVYCNASNTVQGVAAGNDYYFGFAAAPGAYATTGIRTFIVNQSGTLYAVDSGGAANVWLIDGVAGGQWPADDPTSVGRDGLTTSTPKWAMVE